MLSRFRRVTSNARYIPEIDGIRFLAIGSVFLFHLAGDILRHSPEGYRNTVAGSWLFEATQRMNFGVQMFFVLSGLVLAIPFASFYLKSGSPVSLRRYFLRRVTRLEPPYIAALIIFFLLKLMAARGGFAELVPHMAASMAYLHNLIYGVPSDINFVAWSLEIEVQFYLCAPLLAALFYSIQSDFIRRWCLASACVAAAVLASFPYDRISLSLAGQLPWFLAGLLLADFYVRDPHPETRHEPGSPVWDIGCLLSIPLIIAELRSGWSLIYAAPLTVCLAYYAAFHSVWMRRFLRLPFVSALGGMCYSLYLLHNYVIAAEGMLTERLSAGLPFAARLAAQCLLIAPVVLIVCGTFYLLIERPCMQPDWHTRLRVRVSNWLSSQKPGAAVAVVD